MSARRGGGNGSAGGFAGFGAGVLLLVAIAAAPLVAACDDLAAPSGARTPMVTPTEFVANHGPSASPTASASAGPTLPTTKAWNGTVIRTLPSNTSSQIIGVGADGTVYLSLLRALSTPVPSGRLFPDYATSVDAIGRDGSHKAGWPVGGVAVAGLPVDYKLAGDGTVYVESFEEPQVMTDNSLSNAVITAIGSNGKIVSGWPYRTPKSRLALNAQQGLSLGRDGRVCFNEVRVDEALIDCLGRTGKPLQGWPYAIDHGLGIPVIGPDGTLYDWQIVPTFQEQQAGLSRELDVWPSEVLALDSKGKIKPAWAPWAPETNEAPRAILPSAGGVFVVVDRQSPVGGAQGTRWILLGADGRQKLAGTIAPAGGYADCHSATLMADGTLLVSTNNYGSDGTLADGSIYEIAADGSPRTGWPVHVQGFTSPFLSPDGSVWAVWTDYGDASPPGKGVIAVFNPDGSLRAGFPVLGALEISNVAFGPDGTAYVSAGTQIVAIPR